MRFFLYSISPQTKERIIVGEYDIIGKIATFYISPKRFFHELPGFGRDVKVFPKKDIRSCEIYRFKLWDGREYWIREEVFRENSWKYPPKNSMEYKATPLNFEPKLVLTMEKWEKLKMSKEEIEEIKSRNFSRAVL